MKTALVTSLLLAAGLMACGPGTPPPSDSGGGGDTTAPPADTGGGGDATLPPGDSGGGVPPTLAGGVRTCMPGSMVVAGCNQGCTMPLGMCSGDPTITICPGSATTALCTVADRIDYNDDGLDEPFCGGTSDAGIGDPMGAVNVNLCPMVQFTCPADGMYTIWTAGFSMRMAMCMPAVR